MKLNLKKLNITPEHFLKKCGYLEIINPHNQKISYVRSLDFGRFYPRFHVYIEKTAGQFTLNLHLDAKKPSYEGTSAHSGEYEGAVVEAEAGRIKTIYDRLLAESPAIEKPIGFQTAKKPWWKKIFWKVKTPRMRG